MCLDEKQSDGAVFSSRAWICVLVDGDVFFLVVFRYDLITQYWYTVVLPPFQSNRSIEYTRTSIISDTSEEYNALCYMHLLPSRGTEKISHRASSKEKV